jgi:hypothetical protein
MHGQKVAPPYGFSLIPPSKNSIWACGFIFSAFPMTLENNGKRSTSGTSRQYLVGTAQINSAQLNNGQHNVKIKTTNGNVYIREI